MSKSHEPPFAEVAMSLPLTNTGSTAKGIERLAQEAEPLLEKATAEYLGLEVHSVLNRCANADRPFAWTINPYRGCELGCRYCYARYTHEFMGFTRWQDFEEKIYIKRNAARILRRELTPARLKGQQIALGTATDPYQPAERRYRVTRSLLEVIAHGEGLRLSITTKGDLITRDLDLLRRIALRNRLRVYITITTVDRTLARALEPRVPPPERRLAALRTLANAGIPAGVALSPIMPDLTDDPASLEAVIAAAAAHGASYLSWNVLFLKPGTRQAFFDFLERHAPHLRARYATRYAHSAFLDRPYTDRIRTLVGELKRKHGFPETGAEESPTPIHEAEVEPEQLPLFRIVASASPHASGSPCADAGTSIRGNRPSDAGQLQPMGYSEPSVKETARKNRIQCQHQESSHHARDGTDTDVALRRGHGIALGRTVAPSPSVPPSLTLPRGQE
ncbi:MAG: radical SAM protein [candidate division NC10 bacterium]|nr:radical SAM protein [candidate division NC10 bacterium]